jgi:RES domain-containing protein
MPFVMAALELRLSLVLDLTNCNVQESLGVSMDELLSEKWCDQSVAPVTTQLLGQCAYLAHFEAMLVPSAVCPAHTNIVVFPENLADTVSKLDIVNTDLLPPIPGRD